MSAFSGNSTRNTRSPRPFSVTLLALGVLTIAGLNLTRLIEAIDLRVFLAEYPEVPVLYLALSGLFWGMLGFPIFWGLWSGRRWALPTTIAYALAYSVYFWVDRLMSAVRISERNSPFMVGANLFLLLMTGWILSRRKARSFFGEQHEK